MDAQLIAAILSNFPGVKVVVEGHCDERGSAEYNLALGDNRAGRTAEALRRLGLSAIRLETVSFGEERVRNARRSRNRAGEGIAGLIWWCVGETSSRSLALPG